jgi:DNA polymerase-3 subunit epsilon
MDYYTIDFETANSNLTSACSIGIIGVKNNQRVFEKHYLINPMELFDPFTIEIHHITYDDVKDAPTFDILWNNIKHIFNNTVVFSHNSGFDFGVLKSLLEKYNIEKPIFKFGCTVRVARLLWNHDEMPNHKLDTVALYLGYEFNHHNALSDASVCVEIIKRGMKMMQVYDVYDLYNALGLRFGYLGPNNYYNTYQLRKRTKKQLPKVHNTYLLDQILVLSGKPTVMKRKELIGVLEANGAYVDSIVTNRANYFVKLDNYKEERLKQAEEFIKQGIDIKIITETEMVEMVKKWSI